MGIFDLRHYEIKGCKKPWHKNRTRLIVDSGFSIDGIFLELSTAPNKSDRWPNIVALSAEQWEKLAAQVQKILAHCAHERRKIYLRKKTKKR